MPLTQVTPTAFTLFDGVQEMDDFTSPDAFFTFATDPSGQSQRGATAFDSLISTAALSHAERRQKARKPI